MNMQALLKQAKSLQEDMLREKELIEKQIYEEKNGLVTVKVNGKKEILKITIDSDNLDLDDIDALEDMLLLSINAAFKKIDKETSDKMEKFNIPGMF